MAAELSTVADMWAVDTVAGKLVAYIAEEALEWDWARAAADSSGEYMQERYFAEVDSRLGNYMGLRTIASGSDFLEIFYIPVLS